MGFILVEDLDDVAVGLRIQKLEYISSSRKVNVWKLDRLVDGDYGALGPLVGPHSRQGEHHENGERES